MSADPRAFHSEAEMAEAALALGGRLIGWLNGRCLLVIPDVAELEELANGTPLPPLGAVGPPRRPVGAALPDANR